MTALIIIGVIIFLILLICNIPVTAYVKYYGGKADIRVKYAFVSLYPKKEKPPKKKRVKDEEDIKELADMYEFSEDDDDDPDIPDDPPEAEKSETDNNPEPKEKLAPKEKPKPQKKSLFDKKKPSAPKEEKPKEKKSLSQTLDELEEKKNSLQLLIELIAKPLKSFCGKIRIDALVIDFAAANEDAAQAALAYGKLGAAVYNGIALLKSFVKTTIRSVTVDCLYNTPKEKSRYDGECKVRLRPASLINAVLAVIFAYLFNRKKYAPVMELIKK